MNGKLWHQRGSSLTGYGLIVGLISVLALGAISGTGQNVNSLFDSVAGELDGVSAAAPAASASPSASAAPAVYASCNALAVATSPSPGYAVATIDPSGSDPFDVLCYFDGGTHGGGGFTAVVAQYEDNPILWNEGRQPDYQPDLPGSPGTSFALTGSDIPSHSHILFGRVGAGVNDNIDVLPFTYTSGDIPVTLLTSPETGLQYQIYRSTGAFYSAHDPENAYQTGGTVWKNTLTIDQTGGIQWTWAFSPLQSTVNSRSFSYEGDLQPTSESWAWVVFVR